MATPTYTQVATRWYAIACTGRGTYLKHPYMRCTEDILFGTDSIELARVLRHRNGSIRTFLMNGDGGGSRVRFTNQQWEVRNVIQSQFFQNMILPFTALDAAQIDRATIIPIEVRPDEWVTTKRWHESFDIEQIVWGPVPESRWDYHQIGRIPDRSDLMFQRQCKNRGSYARDPEVIAERDRPEPYVFGMPGMRSLTPSGKRWYSEESVHRLGDSVFRAKAHGAYRTYVSSFDYQERDPLYFLAELPWKAKVESVDDAIRSLAPPIVQQAWTQKRVVCRQGDIFCIPTDLTTDQIRERTGTRIERMQGVLGTDHVVTEQLVGRRGVTYARGWMHHKPEGRRADHRRVFLGKKWHLVVPNAVPRRRAGAMVRG